METKTGRASRQIGCDVPAAITFTKQRERADRMTPAQPARATCRSGLLSDDRLRPTRKAASPPKPGRCLPRSNLTADTHPKRCNRCR